MVNIDIPAQMQAIYKTTLYFSYPHPDWGLDLGKGTVEMIFISGDVSLEMLHTDGRTRTIVPLYNAFEEKADAVSHIHSLFDDEKSDEWASIESRFQGVT